MTNAQFDALAKLMRMRGGSAQETARLVIVDGLSVPDACRKTGLDPRLAHRAVKNARACLELSKLACGIHDQSK